jgi:hypothetical protein
LRIKDVVFLGLIALLTYGCGVYSFTGATLSPDTQTISIQQFFDEVGTGPPNLSQKFSEGMREYFQRNTSLTLVDSEGDLQFEGSITGYRLSPLAPTASGNRNFPDADVAGLQRLTITIKTTYINLQDESKDFDQNFSFYADYDPETQNFNSIEDELVDEIFDQIILDIFNATIADW